MKCELNVNELISFSDLKEIIVRYYKTEGKFPKVIWVTVEQYLDFMGLFIPEAKVWMGKTLKFCGIPLKIKKEKNGSQKKEKKESQ